MKAKEALELLDITQPTLGTYCKKASYGLSKEALSFERLVRRATSSPMEGSANSSSISSCLILMTSNLLRMLSSINDFSKRGYFIIKEAI